MSSTVSAERSSVIPITIDDQTLSKNGFAGFSGKECDDLHCSGLQPHAVKEGTHETDEGKMTLNRQLEVLRKQDVTSVVLMRRHEFANVFFQTGQTPNASPTEKLTLVAAGISDKEAAASLLKLIKFHQSH